MRRAGEARGLAEHPADADSSEHASLGDLGHVDADLDLPGDDEVESGPDLSFAIEDLSRAIPLTEAL